MATQADLALQSLSQSAPNPAPAPARTQADAALNALSQQRAAPIQVAHSGDGWDTPVAGAPRLAPATSMPTSSTDFISAAMHHLEKSPAGAVQLIAHNQLQQLQGLSQFLPKSFGDAVNGTVGHGTNALDKAIANRETTYQQSTPDSPAAYAGATVGEVAPLLVNGASRAFQGIGDAADSLATRYLSPSIAKVGGKIAAGAGTGAVMGGIQPVTTPLENLINTDVPGQNDYWTQKGEQTGLGALGGSAFAGGTSAAGAAFNKVGTELKAAVFPQKYAAAQIGNQLGKQTPAVIDALKNAPTYVPGSSPTAAQAAGTPELVMMEKALNNNNKDFARALLQRQNENNAARLGVVRGIAGTPDDLQAAIDARNAVTDPMRDFTVTNGNPVSVGGIRSAVNGVANGPLGVDPTIGRAAADMRNKLAGMTTVVSPNTMVNSPGTATASPAMVDQLRQVANKFLSDNAPNGAVGNKEQAAMLPIKGSIIAAINDANPGYKVSQGGWGQGLPQMGPEAPSYRDYLTEFAKRSTPINTMEVGQELNGILSGKGLNSNLDPGITLDSYRSALARALKTTDYPIDPQAQKALEAVQSDLQRSTVSNSIRVGGSDTAFNQGAGKAFLRSVGAADGSNIPALVSGLGTTAVTGSPMAGYGVGVGVKNAGGFIANRVGNATGKLLLDPQLLAEELKAQTGASVSPQLGGQFNNPALAAALLLQLTGGRRANVQPVE